MAKKTLKPDSFLYPVPAVLVSSLSPDGKENALTIAWTGIICSDPPYVSVSIRPSRLSYEIITQTGEFVINVPSAEYLEQLDYCGVVSGRDGDKLSAAGLTTIPARVVKAPLIEQAKVHLECRVKQMIPLGTHHLFIAEVVATHADESVLNEHGRIDPLKLNPIAYIPHGYYGLSGEIGKYGMSKKK